jgi:flagellar biosynthetic protein FliR
MYEITSGEIAQWIGRVFWPMIRISGMMLVAPVFSNQNIPNRIRVALIVLLTIVAVPMVREVPAVDPLSVEGIMISLQQLLIGLLSGFLISAAFSIVVMAGENIAFKMGLGFATMADPQNNMSVPIVSQFLLLISSLVFIALGGHFLLLSLILQSFETLPISVNGIVGQDLMTVVEWGSQMFAGSLLLAIPVITILILVNMALGIMTRAAPQLNIFSVGFPITLMIGLFLILTIFLPSMLPKLTRIWGGAFEVVSQLLGV